jgi:hypothetical protein
MKYIYMHLYTTRILIADVPIVVSALYRGINDKHHLRVEVLYYYQINKILIYSTLVERVLLGGKIMVQDYMFTIYSYELHTIIVMIENVCRLVRFMEEGTRYRYIQIGSSIRYINMFIGFLKVHCIELLWTFSYT